MLDRALIEHCPVCGELPRSPWLYGQGFELVRCDACGHRYSTSVHVQAVLTKPKPAASARGRIAERQRSVEYLRLLGSDLPIPARVLDVGCNASALVRLLTQRGFQACGVKVAGRPALVASYGERVEPPIWQRRVEDCLPQNERFELIVLSRVLEYVHQPGSLLQRLRSALSASGRLLVEVPNADDRLLALWRGAYRPLSPGAHVSFFDAPHLEQLLDAHGFVVERMAAPTHARDLWYPSVQSAADAARAVIGRSRSHLPRTVHKPRRRGLRRPLGAALDACLSAIDPAVELMYGRERAQLRGPVLIAVARAAAAH